MNTLTTRELERLLDARNDVLLVNVLGEEAFLKEHIPDSANVPLGAPDFLERIEKLARTKDRDIVLYCAGSDCDTSPKAAEALEKEGFDRVFNYGGGVQAWREAGKPVATGAEA